ncbi:tetraacyldisaccharide 4'-kinase [Stenoxybacter acetivorans]|uniref:tetraacyldisaccharide 4'-kinase n=1 Tax=Stenoxybacter acetivorans TaxID=422441 RepID=UPI00055DC8D1|nr:tetraacyldisaccharide 4'-kinase [Stenoxybacter acetivorans]
MTFLQRQIEQHWQEPRLPLSILLYPFSRLFQFAVWLRRILYASGCLKSVRLPVSVVVVGNIQVGGVGKTPITAALVSALQEAGIKTGVISRGYGRQGRGVAVVNAQHTAAEVGDEPLMLYRQTAVPLAVGADRAAAAAALLRANPEIRLLISDDGLQHYALARDFEIAVFPAADVGRYLDILPNGALREPPSRLRSVDAVLVSLGDADTAQQLRTQYRLPENTIIGSSSIDVGMLYQLNQPQHTAKPTDFIGKRIAAVAAIARPQRFFNSLRQLGMVLNECKALPDHAALNTDDFPAADVVIITEKDAVKCRGNDLNHVWVLPIRAVLAHDWQAAVLSRLMALAETATIRKNHH